MLRAHKAWILLVTFVLGCAQGVLFLGAHAGGKACCASTSCCASGNCPMRVAPATKSKSCHMAGGPHQSSPRVIACTCFLSSGESLFNLAPHFDYRFDLPRPAPAPAIEVSSWLPVAGSPHILAGYTFPPDQPPEVSS